MKAYVTLDYWDGSKSKMKEISLDGCNISQLIFSMMTADVAGFTVTKKVNVMDVIKHNEKKEL